MSNPNVPDAAIAPDTAMAAIIEKISALRANLNTIVMGQADVVDGLLACLLADGHALIIGLPGVAKTRLVKALAARVNLGHQRIQCTPDLMPADILGAEVLGVDDKGARALNFVAGPVFTNVLLADEINRASPRTQSALLQAMAEYQVTQSGQTHALARPFHVFATQNPIEQDGTFPLPEAQLDRFLMAIHVPMPSRDDEINIITATQANDAFGADILMQAEDILAAQDLVRAMPVSAQVIAGAVDLVRALRPDGAIAGAAHIRFGPGPRAAQALVRLAKARALLDGRFTPIWDDVVAIARPVLGHRIGLHWAAQAEDVSVDGVIAEAVAHVDQRP